MREEYILARGAMTKNVALAPASASASRTSGVQIGSGPSSNVRATEADERRSVCIALVVSLARSGCGVGAAFAFRAASQGYVELLQLLFGDGTGRVHHLVAGGLGLRESHHLADVRLVCEQHEQAVHAWRDPAVRRRAVAERREDRPEPPLSFLTTDPDDVEDLLLQVGAVDPDAPRGQLGAV